MEKINRLTVYRVTPVPILQETLCFDSDELTALYNESHQSSLQPETAIFFSCMCLLYFLTKVLVTPYY